MGWTEFSDGSGFVGDEGWDLAHKFLDELNEAYNRVANRNATYQEIISTIDFVFRSNQNWKGE